MITINATINTAATAQPTKGIQLAVQAPLMQEVIDAKM